MNDQSKPPATTLPVPASLRRLARVEVALAFLLSVASLLTAWSGYQASRWGSRQGAAMGQATTYRVKASTEADLATANRTVDVLSYSGWLEATLSGDDQKAQYYRERFRAEFRPIFEEWLKEDPMNNAGAPPSPFALPEYRTTLEQRSAELRATADEYMAQTATASQNSGGYVRNTLYFALALFFAGLSRTFDNRNLVKLMVAISAFFVVVGLIGLFTLPIA